MKRANPIFLLAFIFYGVPTLAILFLAIALQWVSVAMIDMAEAINQSANLLIGFARNLTKEKN
jgi:hypothetical protein